MEVLWVQNGGGSLPVNLSIKGVPKELAQRVRTRARLNHRSLQGELMAMLETHAGARPFKAMALLKEIRALRLSTPDESVQMVREDRDSR